MKPKILIILGSTATGKSSLGVDLAEDFEGEIVSADSRQVYKDLDIGTGKISLTEMHGIPHHLLDVVSIEESFSVANYKKRAEEAIDSILSRDKLPIIVGGTGFYTQAIVDGVVPPSVPPDESLRSALRKKNTEELFEILKTKDPERAKTIDKHNKRRLIRALEIVEELGSVPPIKKSPRYTPLQIGLNLPSGKLRRRIERRVEQRLEHGWIEEVTELVERGVAPERLREIGLGYRCIIDAGLENLKPNENLEKCILRAEWQYATRQRTWFKRDERIKWFYPNEAEKIKKVVKNFLTNNT